MNGLHKPIILCGFMAAGKTTIGQLLAQQLDIHFIDTDEMIVEREGLSVPEIFKSHCESYFRDAEYEIIKQIACMKDVVISTGGGLLTFDRNGKVLKNKGIIILIKRNFDSTYNILSNDTTRPMVYGKSKAEVRALYDTRVDLYSKYADFIVSNDSSPQNCINEIIKFLR